MIKIMHMVSGNIIAAYRFHPIPVFEKCNPDVEFLSPEALETLREKFNRTRVIPAIERNEVVSRQIAFTLLQCGGLLEIDTGNADVYCPPEVVSIEN